MAASSAPLPTRARFTFPFSSAMRASSASTASRVQWVQGSVHPARSTAFAYEPSDLGDHSFRGPSEDSLNRIDSGRAACCSDAAEVSTQSKVQRVRELVGLHRAPLFSGPTLQLGKRPAARE